MGSICSKVDKENTKQPIVSDISMNISNNLPLEKHIIIDSNHTTPIKNKRDRTISDDWSNGNSTNNSSKTKSGQTMTTTASCGNIRNITGDDDILKKQFFSYKKGNLIGKGSFGEVYECLNICTGELLAVKTIKISGDEYKLINHINSLQKIIFELENLNHQNIVKYYGIDINEQSNEIDIIFEYVSAGSIRFLLDRFKKLHERIIALYTKQILEGLYYLHSNDIMHGNIKGSNVLIDANGIIKLTDFGYSKKLDNLTGEDNLKEDILNDLPKSIQGSAYWMAPEVLIQHKSSIKSDIWSVGCVVIEMLTGIPPWINLTQDIQELYQLLLRANLPNLPDDTSANCRDFISKTLKYNPEERPTALELLDHSFIKEGVIAVDTSMSILSSQYTMDYGESFARKFTNGHGISQFSQAFGFQNGNISFNNSSLTGIYNPNFIIRNRGNTQTYQRSKNVDPNEGKFYSHGHAASKVDLNSNNIEEFANNTTVSNINALIASKRDGMGNGLAYFSQSHCIPLTGSIELRYQPTSERVIEDAEEHMANSYERRSNNNNNNNNMIRSDFKDIIMNNKKRKNSQAIDKTESSSILKQVHEESNEHQQQKKDSDKIKAEKRKKLEEELKKQLEKNK